MGIRRIGTAFFAIGLIFAVILGVLGSSDLFELWAVALFMWVLFAFGLITGFLNLAKEDAEDLLYTSAVLVLAAFAAIELSRIDFFSIYVVGAAKGMLAFVFPAALVIGTKRIWDLGIGF